MDKENILKRASNLMMRYGVRSVTMDDLARDMGISKKTLYKNFANKADLVRHAVQMEIHEEKKEIDRIATSAANVIEGMVQVNAFVEVLFQQMNSSLMYDLHKYYHACWEIVEDFHRGFIYEKIKTNLEIGISEGLYRAELNVDIITKLFIEMSLFTSVSSDNFDAPRQEVCRESFQYHMHGITTQKGLKLFYEILSKRSK